MLHRAIARSARKSEEVGRFIETRIRFQNGAMRVLDGMANGMEDTAAAAGAAADRLDALMRRLNF
jgi:hypothetical protein